MANDAQKEVVQKAEQATKSRLESLSQIAKPKKTTNKKASPKTRVRSAPFVDPGKIEKLLKGEKPEQSTGWTMGPHHVWSCVKVLVDGTWYQVPQSVGAPLNIQVGSPGIIQWTTPFGVAFDTNPFNTSYTGYNNPITGNPCTITTGPAGPLGCCIKSSLDTTNPGLVPWFNDFYTYAVSQYGTINLGDTIVYHVDPISVWPSFCYAVAPNQVPWLPTGTSEMVTSVCLKYEGLDIPMKHLINQGVIVDGNDASMFTWFQNDTGNEVDCCDNCDPNPNICGEIGDVNPITGGILFSKPGVGQNPLGSGWYYEVAPDDVALSNTPPGPFSSAGALWYDKQIPTSCFNTDCGVDRWEKTYVVNTASTSYIDHSQEPPATIINTSIVNNLWGPMSGMQWITIGYGPLSDNPALLSTDILPGDKVDTYNQAGNPSAFFWYDQTTMQQALPGDVITVTAVVANAANTQGVGGYAWPFTTMYIQFSHYFWDPSQTAQAGFNWAVIASPPFWSIDFSRIAFAPCGPSTPTGLNLNQDGPEFGEWQTGVITSEKFGDGWDNTQTLFNTPLVPGINPTLWNNLGIPPTQNKRSLAAAEAIDYNPTGTPLTALEQWFVPSLDEFYEMWANVGPNSPFTNATNIITPTAGSTSSPWIPPIRPYYWTSSIYHDQLNNPIIDPEKYGWAVGSSGLSSINSIDPKLIYRCHPLIVRPIRRYECPPEDPDPKYNYRDGPGKRGVPTSGMQNVNPFLEPFLGMYVPGMAGSGGNFSSAAPYDRATIGYNRFRIALAETDVLGNRYNSSDFAEANNPTGYWITIHDNQKNFIGKWHYAKGGYNFGNTHILNTEGTTQFTQPTGQIYNKYAAMTSQDTDEFPNLMHLGLEGVTHLAGPHSVYRYGHNDDPSPVDPSGNPIYYPNNQTANNPIPYDHYGHPYMENVYNGWTSSYCYIKFECAVTISNPFESMNYGPNTSVNSAHVVCMKDMLLDPHPDTGMIPPIDGAHTFQGGILGVGNKNRVCFDPLAPPGSSGNWQIGNTYGINYVAGEHPDGTTTGNLPAIASHPKHYLFGWFASYPPSSPGMTWYPDFHTAYAHCKGVSCEYNLGDVGPAGGIIVGVPSMVGNEVIPFGATSNDSDWYYEVSPVDLHFLEWPMGMQTTFCEWGAAMQDALFRNIPYSAELYFSEGGNYNQSFIHIQPNSIGLGLVETNPLVTDTNYIPYTPLPTSFLRWAQGIGSLQTGGNQMNPLAENAFVLCENYETVDPYGTVYNDWYLPNIQEMWMVCNNYMDAMGNTSIHPDLPPGEDDRASLYWVSNQNWGPPDQHPLFGDSNHAAYGWSRLDKNTMFENQGPGFTLGIRPSHLNKENSAYAINVNERIVKQGPVGPGPTTGPFGPPPTGLLNWEPLDVNCKAAYLIKKWRNCGVRAMRRFRCVDTEPPVPGGGGVSIVQPPAPDGFHYMPDGTLMSDAEHVGLYGEESLGSYEVEPLEPMPQQEPPPPPPPTDPYDTGDSPPRSTGGGY